MIRDEKGQALIEFALVFPIFLLLLVGIVDIGRLFYTYSGMHFTAQETVRIGGLGGTDEEMTAFAKDHLAMADGADLSVSISPNQGGRRSGQYVTVTLRYPFSPLVPLKRLFLPDGLLLETSSTIRVE